MFFKLYLIELIATESNGQMYNLKATITAKRALFKEQAYYFIPLKKNGNIEIEKIFPSVDAD
jgi:hypothetical protein